MFFVCVGPFSVIPLYSIIPLYSVIPYPKRFALLSQDDALPCHPEHSEGSPLRITLLYQAITVCPFINGCNTSGIAIDPSAC